MDISRLSSQIDAELVDNYGELANRVIATWEHWREVTSDETVAVLQGLVHGFSDELLSDTDEQALVQGVLGSYLACRVGWAQEVDFWSVPQRAPKSRDDCPPGRRHWPGPVLAGWKARPTISGRFGAAGWP